MTDRVVVIGASGFGRETLDVLEAMRTAGTFLEVVGVVDDSPSDINLSRLQDRGIPYLGTLDDWLRSIPLDSKYIVGVGSPVMRQRIADTLEKTGLKAFTAVHPQTIIGTQTEIAEGVVICAGAVISTNVRLDRHVHINPGAIIGHDTILEEFVSVNPGAVLSGDVIVQSGVLVGASAAILQQRSIGSQSVIGAGALVTKDVPSNVTVIGVPGRW